MVLSVLAFFVATLVAGPFGLGLDRFGFPVDSVPVGFVGAGLTLWFGSGASRKRRTAVLEPSELPAPTVAQTGTANVLAILTLVFGLLGGVIAIPLGHVAHHQIKRTGESGRGLATAGLILGYVWLAAMIAVVVWFLTSAPGSAG